MAENQHEREGRGRKEHHHTQYLAQLRHRHTAQNHHHIDNQADKQGRREVFKKDGANDKKASYANPADGLAVGPMLCLGNTKNLRHYQYECALADLGGLKLYAQKTNPTLRTIGALSAKEHPYKR